MKDRPLRSYVELLGAFGSIEVMHFHRSPAMAQQDARRGSLFDQAVKFDEEQKFAASNSSRQAFGVLGRQPLLKFSSEQFRILTDYLRQDAGVVRHANDLV